MTPPTRCRSVMCQIPEGDILQMLGVLRLTSSMSFKSSFTPASEATARVCSTVLELPPMAMSSASALRRLRSVT